MAKTRVPNAPNKSLWIIALIAGGLGTLAEFVAIDGVSNQNFWFLLVGFGLLAIGTSFKDI